MAFKIKFSLLDASYVPPVGGGSWLRMPKTGSPIKFIIVGQAITGFSYWTDDKQCLRFREYPKSTPGIKVENGKSKVAHFWVLPVYDCLTEGVKLLEITQRGVQDQLTDIFNGGDYDLGSLEQPMAIKISATGEGLTTKYTLMPVPAQVDGLLDRLNADPMAGENFDEMVFTPKGSVEGTEAKVPSLPAIPPTEALDRM